MGWSSLAIAQQRNGTFRVVKVKNQPEPLPSEVIYHQPGETHVFGGSEYRFEHSAEDVEVASDEAEITWSDGSRDDPMPTVMAGLYQLNSTKVRATSDSTLSGSTEYLRFFPNGKVYYIRSDRSSKRVNELILKKPHKLERVRGSWSQERGALSLSFDHYIKTQEYDLAFTGQTTATNELSLEKVLLKDEKEVRTQQNYTLCRLADVDMD